MKHQIINKETGAKGAIMVIAYAPDEPSRIQSYSYDTIEDFKDEWALYEPAGEEESDNLKDRKVVDLRSEWDRIARQIAVLNKLIEQAILHGGDGGGSYLTNRDGLEEAINDYLDVAGLKALVDVYWKDEDDPLLILNDARCHCPGCIRNYKEALDD